MRNPIVETTRSGVTMCESFEFALAGAKDYACTLSRGSSQDIKKVVINIPSPTAGIKIIVCRKDSATTSNERDPTHADSKGVFFGSDYLDNGPELYPYMNKSDKQLRLYIDPLTATGAMYVTVHYDPVHE